VKSDNLKEFQGPSNEEDPLAGSTVFEIQDVSEARQTSKSTTAQVEPSTHFVCFNISKLKDFAFKVLVLSLARRHGVEMSPRRLDGSHNFASTLKLASSRFVFSPPIKVSCKKLPQCVAFSTGSTLSCSLNPLSLFISHNLEGHIFKLENHGFISSALSGEFY